MRSAVRFRLRLPPLFAVLTLAASTFRTLAANIAEAREADSAAGEKITREETEDIAGSAGIAFGEGLAELLLKANGL